MVLVEFLDNHLIENVSGALSVCTDRIIFVGQSNLIKKIEWELENILEYRGFTGPIEYRRINPYDEENIISEIVNIIETNDNCIFDITGGNDLVLFAFGRVYERYSAIGIKLHWLNVHTGREKTVGDVKSGAQGPIVLSVEENIMLHGGVVVYDDMKPDGTHKWSYDDEFIADIEKMWGICRRDSGQWNYQITLLAEIEKMNAMKDEDNLLLEVNSIDIFSAFKGTNTYPVLTGIFPLLHEVGLFTLYHFDKNFFRVRYKNEQVKLCLTKAGTILELKTFLMAKQLRYHDGASVFEDGKVGVYIDWDGQVHEWWDDVNTENEVDVVMMKGLVPVFISCKNGAFDVSELYKLSTVADYFGSGYAKKILVCADESKLIGSQDHFFDRAGAMGIKVIKNVASITDEAFRKRLMEAIM